jgi:hypothetical protein
MVRVRIRVMGLKNNERRRGEVERKQHGRRNTFMR